MAIQLPFKFSGSSTAALSGGSARPSKMMEYDQPLVWVTLLLMLFGMVMVYSASIALPDSPKFANYTNNYFLKRQAMFVGVSIIVATFAFRVRVAVWQRYAPVLFVATLVLLAAVLIPGIGVSVNGAQRWLNLKIFNLQPSEVMKIAAVLYAADYTVRKQEYMHKLTKGFMPMAAAIALVGGLLLLEPDLGAFGVIVCIAMGILFLGGINIVWFGGIGMLLVAIFGAIIALSPFRRARMFAYLDPWQEDNALDKAYQLTHSLIAFGRGEFFGVGLGASVEKLHYLPEAHTDFIMAVIGEELGLAGVLVVIAMFYWLVKRAFDIGRQAIAIDQTFAGLAAKGIGIWIGVQTFINMGVNLGLLPTKGLTLPLMSYGGSGVLINCVGLAILLRIDYENRVLMRGGRL
ncbi:putative lipid II flippase FtsW [Massilia cavernae]|uniref:Probable peptidoglycan glycosyltransferase FtsW n=2 Tax=Massilia cavernae TaxID=2320864 RepID=A0A418XA85_9BURK|nr:putative lipid II flippase FtsW [Massilia cavernae]RJG09425.1 putative lipid II flippase FtsW [Massilia cavernae]